MNLITLKNADVANKTVLYRSPYDIGVKETSNGEYEIKDDSRITCTLETLNYLREQNCKIVILTWVGRPEGVEEKLRTTPHAKALSKLLGVEVQKANDCIGEEVQKQISNLKPKELLMLENVRFHSEENDNDLEFAEKLTKGCDVIVFDGFPQSHRMHSSTTGVMSLLPSVAGFYAQKELESLTKVTQNPEKPFTIIIGGAKVSDKVDAVNNLIEQSDHILVGGGTANVFIKAKGYEVGDSYIEDVFVDEGKKEKKDWAVYAKEIMQKYGEKIIIPEDVVIAKDSENPKEVEIVNIDEIPLGYKALDIGPKTIAKFKNIIIDSKTIFWNGPMGMFEIDEFATGTQEIAKAMQDSAGTTIVSGGDTVEAAKKYADENEITHMSLAGGATLEFLSGKKLPAMEMLKK